MTATPTGQSSALAGLSRDLAATVELTSAALYYHFPKGKEELFTQMIQTVLVDKGLAGIDQTAGCGEISVGDRQRRGHER